MAVTLTQSCPYSGVVAGTWTLANGETGTAMLAPRFSDRSVQFSGTYGAGGSVLFEGSNDGIVYNQLHDYLGSLIASTAASLSSISESCLWIRPRCTAGDGTTAVKVALVGINWSQG